MIKQYISFGVSLKERRDIGKYPVLEDLEATKLGRQYSLGYRFRDYGKLSISIMKRLEECSTIEQAPDAIDIIREFYKLPNLVGAVSRVGGSYTKWMIDAECPQVGVVNIHTEKRRKKVFLGPIGVLFLKAASKSSSLTTSFENLVVFRVLAEKIRNLGLVLSVLHTRGTIDCYCNKVRPKAIRQIKGKKTQLNMNRIPTFLRDANLVHCESPDIFPFVVSPNTPMVISGLLYNEIYRTYHALRIPLQKWVNRLSKKLQGLVTIDPYEISDRMAREISRGFEKIGLLQLRGGVRFTSIPDQLLANLTGYFGEKAVNKASLDGKAPPKQLPLASFIKMLREEFCILVNPNDIVEFLEKWVDYAHLGIDFSVARGNLISDYHRFTERLETLDLATIRPDGDVMVRIE